MSYWLYVKQLLVDCIRQLPPDLLNLSQSFVIDDLLPLSWLEIYELLFLQSQPLP
jgi:hypothetical protein